LRTTAGSALVLLIAGALAAPAPAATLQAPGSVAPAEQVAVTVTGLQPGVRYAVFLARDGFAGLPCRGRLARRIAREGRPTVFSGALPTHVRCDDTIPGTDARQQPEPPPGPVPPGAPRPVEPGRGYRFIVCEPAGQDCGKPPEARRSVLVVPTGRACPTVVFTPDSDHGAFDLRARHVSCAVAERVAGGAEGGDRRYTRARMRCRGVFDPHGLPKTVYRCTRRGARVTFVAS
jgi:hypothetical protein